MIHVCSRLKMIQDFGLAFLALAVLISPLKSHAQGKKYVNIVFDENEKKPAKKTKVAQNRYGRQRIPASLVAAPTHGNIVPIHDYVAEVEELDSPVKKPIIKKRKKPIAEDAEISREMVVAK